MIKNERLEALRVNYKCDQPELFDTDDYQTDSESGITPAEARLRSENARMFLGGLDELPEWYEEYLRLLDGGWTWRVAVYIAWASIPKTKRLPKTQNELATNVLGLTSDRQIIKWRKNPVIMDLVSSLQAAVLLEHRADVFNALIKSAQEPDYKSHQDRKLFLEITGDYVPANQTISIKNRSAGDGPAGQSSESLIRDAGFDE